MNVEELLERCQPVIINIAAKYKIKGNALASAEDLEQEQVAKVLEIAANPPQHNTDEDLVRYTLTSCRRTCLALIRDDWRKAGRNVPANVDDYVVMEFVTDGTYEEMRRRLERQERDSLLSQLAPYMRTKHERKILKEIISPSPATCGMLEAGATPKEALAAGTGVSFHLVRKSLTEIRKALSYAA